jgi:hypothetical protein
MRKREAPPRRPDPFRAMDGIRPLDPIQRFESFCPWRIGARLLDDERKGMLSELRWMIFVVLGIGVMVAVWLEPNARDPSGEAAVPRIRASAESTPPAGKPAIPAEDASPETRAPWQERFQAYRSARAELLESGNLPEEAKSGEIEKLRSQYFDSLEIPGVRILDANAMTTAE